jgi:hypothetical protein
MDTCTCGHDVQEHGADVSEIGTEEFKRRGRVAVRLDELLHVNLTLHSVVALLMVDILKLLGEQ